MSVLSVSCKWTREYCQCCQCHVPGRGSIVSAVSVLYLDEGASLIYFYRSVATHTAVSADPILRYMLLGCQTTTFLTPRQTACLGQTALGATMYLCHGVHSCEHSLLSAARRKGRHSLDPVIIAGHSGEDWSGVFTITLTAVLLYISTRWTSVVSVL